MTMKYRIPFTALLLSLAAATVNAADFSANLGYSSEYIFRGIPQKTSSASGGFDVEANGFYAGTWAADVGDGLEVDYYGGYGWESGDFGASIGGTWYTYTGDFDDEYLELNLGLSYKFLSFDYANGSYDNFGGPKLDYSFYTLTASYENVYFTFGSFGEDFDGNYYEAGYGNTLSVDEKDLFDYSIVLIHSDSTLLGGDSDTNLVFSLSKGFDL